MRFLIRLIAVLSGVWAASVLGFVVLTGNRGGADQWLVAAVTAFGTPVVVLIVLAAIAEAQRDV